MGIIYAILILIGSELHGLHLPHLPHIPGLDLHVDGHDVNIGHAPDIGHAGPIAPDVDTSSVKVPSLSPITVASFVTAFGAFGLIGMGLFDASAKTSLIWAGLGGLAIAVIAHFAFGYFLISPQGSSEVRMKDILGNQAEVITLLEPGGVVTRSGIPGSAVGKLPGHLPVWTGLFPGGTAIPPAGLGPGSLYPDGLPFAATDYAWKGKSRFGCYCRRVSALTGAQSVAGPGTRRGGGS